MWLSCVRAVSVACLLHACSAKPPGHSVLCRAESACVLCTASVLTEVLTVTCSGGSQLRVRHSGREANSCAGQGWRSNMGAAGCADPLLHPAEPVLARVPGAGFPGMSARLVIEASTIYTSMHSGDCTVWAVDGMLTTAVVSCSTISPCWDPRCVLPTRKVCLAVLPVAIVAPLDTEVEVMAAPACCRCSSHSCSSLPWEAQQETWQR